MSQINIENQTIENERLALGDKTFYFLGPNLTYRKCILQLRVAAKDLIFIGTRFIDCTFEVKRQLKGARWENAHLKGCRFTGKLSGSDFGHRPDDTGGSIEDCDFSAAELDGCAFFGCDPSTLKFPRWPCFTLLHPRQRSNALMSVKWPGTSDIAISVAVDSPPGTVAVTYSATALAKRSGTTAEAIRAVVENLSDVIL